MSSAPAPKAGSASARRIRYGLSALAIVAFAAISLFLANLIALDPRLRLLADVTATGEHRLAPRTLRVLESLPPGAEIVIAGAAAADPDVRRRIADVLDTMARTRRVGVTWIDDPAGPDYAALLERLVERDRPLLQDSAQRLAASAQSLDDAGAALESFDASLTALAGAIPPADGSPGATAARQWGTRQAATARGLAAEARSAAQAIRDALSQPTALGVPPLDRGESIARTSLRRFAGELDALATALLEFAAADGVPREAALRARTIGQQAELSRRPLALAADEADARRIPDLVRVLRALESAQSALVILPDGLTAIAFDTLFPPAIPRTTGGARGDVGIEAEDLLTSALASLTSPAAPILVITHAEDNSLLETSAMPRLLARLALRRIDVLEWRVVHEPEPPSLAALDPERLRPVIYVALGVNSATSAAGPRNLLGADRAANLGATLRRLSDRGESILLSIAPSYLAATGGNDEATAFLSGFGLTAGSATPLLTERLMSGRRTVEVDRILSTLAPGGGDVPPRSASAILDACGGLPIGMRWTVPIRTTEPPEGTTALVTPLIQVEAADTWGERQWLNFWRIPAEQRASATDPPRPDERLGDDVAGPWTIAYAVERTAPSLSRPQRLVAVGSSGWFFDGLAAQTEVVSGRVVPTVPGNAELFEASISWLAGQEDLIARSAAAGSVPTIRALEPGQRTLIHLLVLAVLPLGILALGLVWRLIRG